MIPRKRISKYAMVGTLPPMKGISAYCWELYSSLSKMINLEFIPFTKLYPRMLYPGGDDKEESQSSEHYSKYSSFKLHGYDPRTWIEVGLGIDAKLVHLQWWSPFLFPAFFVLSILLKMRRIPIVITVHNVKMHENVLMGSIINKMMVELADWVIVHSESNKKVLTSLYSSLKDKRISVIPHGTLFSNEMCVEMEDARRTLGIEKNAKVILFFGNIRPYKGLDTLIMAFKDLVQDHPDLYLLISGQPWKDWDYYQALIKNLGMEDHCILNMRFVNQDEVANFFQAADIVILPYREFEAQSGVGLTAIRFGKPLIVSNVGGLPELVKSQNAIVRPGDVNDLAMKINNVLSSPEVMEELKKDSQENREFFEWGNIAKSTIDIYEELLDRD